MALSRDALFKKLKSKPENKVLQHVLVCFCVYVLMSARKHPQDSRASAAET